MSVPHVGGPVPLESRTYVQRIFEDRLEQALLNQQWGLLLGPRQHGKTSALLRIRARLIDSSFRCAFVDMQALPPVESYSALLRWFASMVARELGSSLVSPGTVEEEELVPWLEGAIPSDGSRVVIIVDEASGIASEEWRNAFFGQLRSIHSSSAYAQAESLVKRLQFAFSGTFRPETLVDERNSPFNVCERIETEDLSPDQISELTTSILGDTGNGLPAEIYQRVGGQPFLNQAIILQAAQAPAENRLQAVADIVDKFTREGSEHLESLFSKVFQNSSLTEIIARVANDGSISNEPANSDLKYLIILGLLKREGTQLVFRNRLYSEVAQQSPQLRPGQQPGFASPNNIYNLHDDSFAFLADPQLREIAITAHRGAVGAYNTGSYRLSLVGFGGALEAVLIDWLLQRQPSELAQARGRAISDSQASFNRRFENLNNPRTWRLINLMKVAREIRGGRIGHVDLPEPLREWRNYVHPAVILQNYLIEGEIEPDARAASGMLASIVRDMA